MVVNSRAPIWSEYIERPRESETLFAKMAFSKNTGGVPFPCVVYTRERADRPYVFSHYHECHVRKTLPNSLRVQDLRAWDPRQNRQAMENACFLVLVAGDVAQCVSSRNHKENRVRFLFTGSQYAKKQRDTPPYDPLHTEFHENCIPLRFYGTMAAYNTVDMGFHSLVPIESGVALLPREIFEARLSDICSWVSTSVQKNITTSVWITENGDSYNEHTLRLTASPRFTR